MKKLKTGHYLLGAFILLVGLLIVMNVLNDKKQEYMEQHGVEALATITDIDVNNYKANELEGRYVENYIFTFQFSDRKGNVITTVKTIEKKDFKSYFDRTLYVNDQISILYDIDDPKDVIFKKLTLVE
ncbi:MAG: hypothetical protein MK076_05855 [Flavobacteriales bacterium]|nr:hypothetical protein [Flavobacteriales bacterium]NQX99864.1 hypothetical protein [Flavobacteriaceae bacterium]